MRRISVALGVAAIAAVVMAAGCANGNEQPGAESPPAASAAGGGTPAGTQALELTFKTEPDPVMMGENTFEATVLQNGKPVTDATVSTEFFMAAMPSMKMPEMRTKTDLTHQGSGVYRGKGQVAMAGDWDVTVTVMRDAQEIGTRKMTLTAK